MAILKAFVIGMGLLIVLGTGILIWAATGGIDRNRGFGTTPLGLAAGTRVLEMTGTQDRLILRVQPPEAGSAEQLLFIDPGRGRLIGRLDLATP